MQINEKFWKYMQRLVDESEIVIDRPKGSCHPKFPETIYITDYGYLKNTGSSDRMDIDVYIGSRKNREICAAAITVNFVKRDSEIKILIGCTDEEIEKIQNQLASFKTAAGLVIKKPLMQEKENFEILKLQLKDFEKCGNIWDLNENKDFTQNIYHELKSGNRETFVYKDPRSGKFLGEISIVFSDDKEIHTIKGIRVYLSRLIVKEIHRSKGIGTVLCNYIFDYCKKLGYKEMSLGVNLDNYGAIKLYHGLGFKEILLVDKDEYGKYVVLLKKLI